MYSDAMKRRNEWAVARKKSTRKGDKVQAHYEMQKERETYIELRTMKEMIETLGYTVVIQSDQVTIYKR